MKVRIYSDLEWPKTESEPKKDFKANLQLETLEVELAKPLCDFLRDYRKYFDSQYTIEQICMSMIYSQVKHLFNELDSFTRKKVFSTKAISSRSTSISVR